MNRDLKDVFASLEHIDVQQAEAMLEFNQRIGRTAKELADELKLDTLRAVVAWTAACAFMWRWIEREIPGADELLTEMADEFDEIDDAISAGIEVVEREYKGVMH